ncbi:hypothetical protein ABE488_00755 [Luteimonas sp. TWI662]|uniref:hypothetical protein n=1 Tax=Luteimonas sp. TWI662 TaxID=3136789 RepID=UPI00320AE6AE
MALNDLTPEAAAAELLRRRRARTSLAAFALSVAIPGAPVDDEDPASWVCQPSEFLPLAAHHRLILDAVQRCLERPMGRLMLFFPPGSAKSTYAGVLAPAWAMGRWPGYKVISTSYAAKPAYRSSKRTRAICGSPEYAAIWPDRTTILAGSAAVDEWSLTNDSTLLAAGLLGGITSARADAAIIDDPVAGRSEADSPTVQASTRAAYDDDLLTRLKPGGSVILIQTRWNPSDLAGSILPENWDGESGMIPCRDGQTWEVICVPAQADREDDPLGRKIGDYLWPEWFPVEHWQQYKAKARTWNSLYQGKPKPESGNQIERDWIIWYEPEELPKRLRYYGASDFAVTEKDLEKRDEPDFTEHGIVGMDEDRVMWLVDWWFGQVELDASVREQLAMIRQWKPLWWYGEKGTQENAVRPIRRLLAREGDTFANYEYLPHIGDKVAKFQAFRAMVREGRVRFPRKPWAVRLVELLINFPRARFDDGPDVCGLLGRGVDDMLPAPPPPVAKRLPKPFTEEWFTARERADAADAKARASYYR